MTKKIPLGITIALIFLTVLLSSVTTILVYLRLNDKLLTDLPRKALQYSYLTEVDDLVRQEYYGEIDSEMIDLNLAKGFLNGLNDQYSYFISSDEYDAYLELSEGNFYGIGITSYYEPQMTAIKITSVEPGSPAEEVGLTNSSYIYAVDGIQINENNCAEIIDKLTGSKNKRFNIKFNSAENVNIAEVEIKAGYRVSSCDYFILNNCGYVRLSAFYEDTPQLFSESLNEFKSEGISSVVLDLRNCSGVNLDIAAKIIDIIVPVGNEGTGAIYTVKNIKGEVIKQVSSDSVASNLNIAVLINSESECAAELIAADLKDFGKAFLIGETTAGHGTMQKTFKLDDGSAVSMTVGRIYPYISDSFDNVGVEPDYEIITSESFKTSEIFKNYETDEQYQYACSYLNGKAE